MNYIINLLSSKFTRGTTAMAESDSFEEDSRMSQLSKEVFEIEKIRAKILLEVLLLPEDDKPSVDKKKDEAPTVQTLSIKQAVILRCVSKTWMETVTGHFRESNQPLFEFSIRRRLIQTEDKNLKSDKHESEDDSESDESEEDEEEENENDPSITKEKERKIAEDKLIQRRNGQLGELLDWIIQGGVREDYLPPISLKLESIAFLDLDHLDVLQRFFTMAPAAVNVIVRLSIMDPEDVLPLECSSVLAVLVEYDGLEFRCLQTLELCHLTHYGINGFFVSFIQKILGCSKNLRHFQFKLIKSTGCEEEDDIDERQNLYQDLLFPPDTLLKSVEVNTQMSFEPFLLANLSKLAILKIDRSTDLLYNVDHLKQFLENCGQNLEELYFLAEGKHEDLEEVPAISLPAEMPRLKVLKLEGSFWKLADDVNVVASEEEDLRSRLPALEVFSANQCVRRLRGRGRHQSESKCEGNPEERIQSVLKSFPNQVAHLELNLAARETTGLIIIFKDMAHLESLKLQVDDNWEAGSAEDEEAAFEAAFVGITIQMIKKLRLNAMTLCGVYQKEAARGRGEGDSGVLPSIRDLLNLKKLSLTGKVTKQAKFNTFTFQSTKKVELLTELSFLLAFMDMRNLKELTLKGSFTASNMMIQNWNGGRDRTIDCDVSKQDSLSAFEHFSISNMEGPFDHRDFLGFPFVR